MSTVVEAVTRTLRRLAEVSPFTYKFRISGDHRIGLRSDAVAVDFSFRRQIQARIRVAGICSLRHVDVGIILRSICLAEKYSEDGLGFGKLTRTMRAGRNPVLPWKLKTCTELRFSSSGVATYQ